MKAKSICSLALDGGSLGRLESYQFALFCLAESDAVSIGGFL
jgi:hypothetical protein